MKNTEVVLEIVLDIDGTPLAECKEVTIAEGITLLYFTTPGASTPHEMALHIGEEYIELNYTEALEDLFTRIHEVSALELLSSCSANLWSLSA